MSNINEVILGNRIFRTDKRFSELTQLQKEMVHEWLFEEYRRIFVRKNMPPDEFEDMDIIFSVLEKMERANMSLGNSVLRKYYIRHKNKFRRRCERECGV